MVGRHEHHAAVWQQDFALELVLPGSDVSPAGERVGARVEQADGAGPHPCRTSLVIEIL